MILFFLSTDDSSVAENQLAYPDSVCMTDIQFFQNKDVKPDAVVIKTGNPQRSEDLLKRIRQNLLSCLLPVFIMDPVSRYYDSLHDGQFTTLPELQKKTDEIKLKLMQMNSSDMMDDPEYRLLAYLYSRNSDLHPVETPLTPQLYQYPLADVLSDDESGILKWVTRFVERGFFSPAKLVDRIRLCGKCEWSHHNFVDICPGCQSLNIYKVPFIHCFTCGHVAPQEKFLSEGIMQCPGCKSKLRHIGSDYDRPMENYYCPDCNQSFIEPRIIAHCANCGQKNNPDDLISWPVHTYKLTAKGKSSAIIGEIEDIFALLDNLNYVNPQYFVPMLDWMLRLCNRYPEDPFSLIGISIKNTLELAAQLGKHGASKLVDAFALRLRQLIRTTDITTRLSEHNLWLMLPKTPSAGCGVLAEKISKLQELTKQPDGTVLEYKIITFTAPEGQLRGETAELLLARLSTIMED